MNRHTLPLASCAAVISGFLSHSNAQTNCTSIGPDIIIGDITQPLNYASQNGIEAFSAGLAHCNIGSAMVNTIASPSTQHQITGQNLYRLKVVNGAARFEQIGQSWMLDGFCSLASSLCCTDCQPAPNCSHLGVHCSSPDTASIAGFQSQLRPKWQVNAANGTFPVPAANPAFSGSVARRLQAKISDLDPTQDGGGSYFLEVYTLAADDAAAGNANNNASYRPCMVTGSGTAWNMSVMGTTQREKPAVQAWQDADPSVTITNIEIPGDGTFLLAAKATDLGGGQWQYEYAIENLTSDRSGGSFSVPVDASVSAANIGFHDVDYHDGDGIGNINFDGTDWPGVRGKSDVSWSTDPFDVNQSANALRFATLYNFRFDANVAPVNGEITLGLFKPGTPTSLTATTIVPGVPVCIADIAPPGGDGTVNVADVLLIINSWGPCAAPCPADIAPSEGDGEVNVADLLGVINAWGPCQ
jgi:hypothetical protein